MIYNYINKSNSNLFLKDFDNANNPGDYILLEKSKTYGDLLCLGSAINTNIYAFTKKPLDKLTICPNPKIKYLIKLIKNLSKIFENYSYEFFIEYIYSKTGNKYISSDDLNIFNQYFSKKKNNNQSELFSKNINFKSISNNSVNKNTNSYVDTESFNIKINSVNKNENIYIVNNNLCGENSLFIQNNDSLELNIKKIKEKELIEKIIHLDYYEKNKFINNRNCCIDKPCNFACCEKNISKDKNMPSIELKKIEYKKFSKISNNNCNINEKFSKNKNLIQINEFQKQFCEKNNKILNEYSSQIISKENKNKNLVPNIFNNINDKVINFTQEAKKIINHNSNYDIIDLEDPKIIGNDENFNSFSKRNLIDSSIQLNSQYCTNSININVINTIYPKNIADPNSFINSFANNVNNTIEKTITDDTVYYNLIKKSLDQNFKIGLSKDGNFITNDDNYFLNNNKSLFNKLEGENKIITRRSLDNSTNKFNLNFIKSLKCRNQSINKLSNSINTFDNNQIIKTKVEISSTNKKIKISDQTYSLDSELNQTLSLNNQNLFNSIINTEKLLEEDYSKQIMPTDKDLSLINESKEFNINNKDETTLSQGNLYNFNTNDFSPNVKNNLNYNLRSNNHAFIPNNKINNKELIPIYYNGKNFINNSFGNISESRGDLRSISKAKQNITKTNERTHDVFKNLLYKNKNLKTSNLNKNYNTDDITSNFRLSVNSFNGSLKNDNNLQLNNNNSNIFVVSRDGGSRYKTELEDSDNSDEDFEENEINATIGNTTDGKDNSEYNTPSKAKVLKYYS